MGAAYQLAFSSLSTMKPGRYSGMLSYRVGDGAEIDLGARLTDISDTVLDVLVELTVKRDIRVAFAPGADRAVLEPPGGWHLWPGGEPPRQLARDLPFRMTIDGPFGVYLGCQYTLSAETCGLRNEQGDEVPVVTSMTLRGATYAGAGAVRVQLPTSESGKRVFDAPQPLLNQPGTVHVTVESAGVKSMFRYPGSTYQGQVLIVFDARL
ncbi:hypothetical protein [Pseudomonas guariconensis]|uniref:hypothetical protein n=1 Tax=Pseudomonas guariconensis TaxID=1288410 RepID=UPI0018AA1277|nr:hypothetical protein [Pseudomonas guariconensis]MBF8723381.1 hypothetical protein [Pseudomonas guariconensis]MBF8795291.1 hypothetical protein [Pseudomonas monteilii]